MSDESPAVGNDAVGVRAVVVGVVELQKFWARFGAESAATTEGLENEGLLTRACATLGENSPLGLPTQLGGHRGLVVFGRVDGKFAYEEKTGNDEEEHAKGESDKRGCESVEKVPEDENLLEEPVGGNRSRSGRRWVSKIPPAEGDEDSADDKATSGFEEMTLGGVLGL